MGRTQGVYPRSSRQRRLSGDFTTEETLLAHLGREATVLNIGRSFAWVGLLTDIELNGYFPFTRIEIRGVKRYFGVRMKDIKTTIRFAKNDEEWYRKRYQHVPSRLPYRVKWHGTPYLESQISKKGKDPWLLKKLAHMPAAHSALTDGLYQAFDTSSQEPLFLDDVWPIIEEQWNEVAGVMTAIGILFRNKMVHG